MGLFNKKVPQRKWSDASIALARKLQSTPVLGMRPSVVGPRNTTPR